MSKFVAERYVQFRPLYPEKTFHFLKSKITKPIKVVDLGAGTGFSTQSFLQVFADAKVDLVEPDDLMQEQSKSLLVDHRHQLNFIHSSAEEFLGDHSSVDLVLIGSAWHWMDREKVLQNISGYLSQGGYVHIFEYQFPKSVISPDLNEWIRRQFNLYWKAPKQTPRGSLKELIEPLEKSKEFKKLNYENFSHQVELSVDDILGEISSQSRFIQFENSLPNLEKENYRLEIKNQLNAFFLDQKPHPFFYRMSSFTFVKNAAKCD